MKQKTFITLALLLSATVSAFADTVKVGYYSEPGMMNGAKRGSAKSGYVYDYLQEISRYTGWNYEYVLGTREDLIAALFNGKIDMLPCFTNDHCTTPQALPFHFAFSVSRSSLKTELDSANERLAEYNPGFFLTAQIKYYSSLNRNIPISPEGKDWLGRHNSIRIGTFDKDEPYAIKHLNGPVTGVGPDYVNLMLRSLGINMPVEWVFYSSKQLGVEALKRGEIDLFNPYYFNYQDAEKDGLIISAEAYSASMSFLYLGVYNEKTMSVIATPNTRLGAAYVRDNYPDTRIIPCPNGFDCIDRLIAGDVGSVIVHTSVLREIAKTYKQEFNIKALNSHCPVCFAAIPENSGLIDVINAGIPFLSDIEMNSIESRNFTEELKKVTLIDFIRQNSEMSLIFLVVLIIGGITTIVIKNHKSRKNTDAKEA